MKKILLLFVIFTFFPATAYAGSFPDVPEDHKNYDAIEFLDEQEIINGYPDGTFGPDNLVNRAEALKMIVEAFEVAHDGSYNAKFPDVKSGTWFFAYVMGAESGAIVNGYPDGSFKPGDTVNMAESLKMMVLASKRVLPEEIGELFFTDVKLSDWYAPYLYYARNHNMVFSDDYGAVHPDQAMTRADFAELLYRLIVVIDQNEEPFKINQNWDYYQSDVLPFRMKYDRHDWEVTQKSDEVIFFKPDREFLQFSDVRVYPNSGVLRLSLDDNSLDLEPSQYFANIRTVFADGEHKEFKLGNLDALEILYPDERQVDWYIYLENGDVLVVYTEYGDGILGFQLQQFIKAMLSTLEYREVQNTAKDANKQLMSSIFEHVLVEGKGLEILNLLGDKIVIETDTIGVGTGPVDYYYSAELNYTIKYERSSDVILDTREGETTAF